MLRSNTASLISAALAVVVALSLAPRNADAGELVPAISSQVGWDSNNDGVTSGEQGDLRARTTPEISIREELGRFGFNAKAGVAYDNALDFGGLDDYFDQFGEVGLLWQATNRTLLTLSNRFARVQSVDRDISVDGFAAREIPDNEGERNRLLRNISTLRLRHQLSSRWSFLADASYAIRDYQSENRFDQGTMSGSGSFTYALDSRTTVGFGGRWTYDSYDGTRFQRGARSRYNQGFLSLDYLIAPDLQMSMSAGPAWVEQRTKPGAIDFRTYPFVTSFMGITPIMLFPSIDPSQPFGFLLNATPGTPGCQSSDGFTIKTGCVPDLSAPVLMTTQNNPVIGVQNRVGGESTSTNNIDVFASFSLVKSWEWGDVTLAYNRRESSSGGLGTGSTSDSISIFTSGYQPAPLWTISGLLNWSQRKSSGDVPEDLAVLSGVNVEVDPVTGLFVPPGSGVVLNNVAIADQNGYVTSQSLGDADELSSFFLTLRAERRISKNLSAFGDWSWRRDDRGGDLQRNSELDIFRIFVGATYTFDPIPF